MKMNRKKKYLIPIAIFIIVILSAACLTVNSLLYNHYNHCDFYGLFGKTAFGETQTILKSAAVGEGGEDLASLGISVSARNNSYTETKMVPGNSGPVFMYVGIPTGFRQLLFLSLLVLISFLTLFPGLPDEWTLVNQKIRLNH